VIEVTLDVEPEFLVAQRVFEELGWSDLIDDFEPIMALGYSVSIFTDWGDIAGQVWVKQRLDAGALPTSLKGARAAQQERHPILGLDPVNCTQQLGVEGPWSYRLPHFRMGFTPSAGEEIQSEFHLSRADGPAVFEALRAIQPSFGDVLQIGEIRTVAGDELWMSPQYQRDSVSVHFTWERDQAGVERALEHVEQALEPFDPRPHWGKAFLGGAAAVGRRYERLADFHALRRRLDPDGKFVNDWLRANLGL
jgi:alditol oxidase